MIDYRLRSSGENGAGPGVIWPWRLLYTSNPFYLISAWLVFYGLWSSFGDSAPNHANALMIGLASYTFLLSVSAVVLIRYCKVWDDARGILVLVVLMLLAISVCFDDALAKGTGGEWYFVAGFIFSVIISEFLLRGARIRLSGWLRGPYYLLLGLFFLYPVGLAPLLGMADDRLLHFALLGFPVAISIALLALAPAVRRGPQLTQANGTPWRWPLYPWTLFVVVACCACFRTYYLCASFSRFDIYGFYFLTPILFAAAILLHEAGIVGGYMWLQRCAMMAPLALLGLSLRFADNTGSTANYFVEILTSEIGLTPQFAVLLAALLYYALAALRRLPMAIPAFAAAVASLSLIGPFTTGLESLNEPWGLPLVLVSLLVMAAAAKHRDLRVAGLAVVCGLLGLTLDMRMAGLRTYFYLREMVSGLEYIAFGVGSFLVAMLISLSKAGFFHRVAEKWRIRRFDSVRENLVEPRDQ